MSHPTLPKLLRSSPLPSERHPSVTPWPTVTWLYASSKATPMVTMTPAFLALSHTLYFSLDKPALVPQTQHTSSTASLQGSLPTLLLTSSLHFLFSFPCHFLQEASLDFSRLLYGLQIIGSPGSPLSQIINFLGFSCLTSCLPCWTGTSLFHWL